jgi:hypothetical protein
MRFLRLFLLGLASIYPLYWTAQFLFFFLPEGLLGYWLGQPVQVVRISYLEATAVAQPSAVFAPQWEALVCAILFCALILGSRGDRFLTGAFAIAVLSQSALLPFVHILVARGPDSAAIAGGILAFALMVLGLYRILQLTGGLDYVERLALLSLVAVLPEAFFWLALRAAYPSFDTRSLLLLLLSIYLAANVAALLPTRLSGQSSGVAWNEILASSAAACLLIIAISLSSFSRGGNLNSRSDEGEAPVIVSR